jgi:hypothetical protein
VFDLHASSKETNHELQDKISSLFHAKIANAINDLFSEYAYIDETIRIDQLSIDTGKFRMNELDEELPGRIVEAMRAELDKLGIRSGIPSITNEYSIVPALESALQTVAHFLNTGTFRWKDPETDIEALLAELILNNPVQLVKLLKKVGKKEHARKRLVYRLKEEQLNAIIHLAEPAYGKLITTYIRESDTLRENKPVIQAGKTEFRKARYLFVLTYLFNERGSVFNTRNFVRSLIRQMAAHYNMSYSGLLLQLVQHLPSQSLTKKDQSLFYFIREIFLEDTASVLAEDLPVFTDPETAGLLPGRQEEMRDQYLYYYLEKGYPPSRLRSLTQQRLRNLLADAINNRPSELAHFIQRSSKTRIAENMLHIADESKDQLLIQQLHPNESNWIKGLVAVFAAANLHNLFSPPLHADTMRRTIREAILHTAFLFIRTSFSRKNFLWKTLHLLERRLSADSRHFRLQVKTRLESTGDGEYSQLIEEKKTGSKTEMMAADLPTKKEKAIDRKQGNKELNALKYFLLHGSSPWWYTPADSHTYRKLLEKHFHDTSRTHLLSFIRRHIVESSFRENLIGLSEDPIRLHKKLYRNNEENEGTQSTWPLIKNALSYNSYKALKEAYLVHVLLRRHKKSEMLWQELRKIFAAHRIDLHSLYEELAPLSGTVPGLATDNFFSFLHFHFTEELSFGGGTFANAGRDQPATKASGKTENKNADAFPELLQYLHTGEVSSSQKKEVKTLILQTTRELDAQKNTHDTRLFFLSLKNETSVHRLLAWLSEQEQEKVMRNIFRHDYELLKKYLDDLLMIFRHETIRKKNSITEAELRKLTLFFLAGQYKKNFRIADYLKFMMKRLFPLHSSYMAFLSLLKANVWSGKLQLKTSIASILQLADKEEKKRDEEQEETEEDDDLIFIENAGLILLSPFFTFYFQTLGLTENNTFVSEQAAARAACLMEYLVTGNEEIKEEKLSLNKILCNLPRQHPIENFDGASEQEKELSSQLLNTAISRWSAIGNTSVEGLRVGFLQRAGKLEWTEETLSLTVESKSYDMLLDKIPWNISMIKLPWMDKTMHVKWR